MEETWASVLDSAALALSQACEKTAESISRGEAGVKDIRELTAALKELTALRRSLEVGAESMEAPTVEVSFDEEGENWSK